MDGSILVQGRFTSDGAAKLISVPSDIDWMKVVNRTQWATTQATGRGVEFFWQRGLSAGQGFETKKADSSVNTLEGVFLSSGGFTLLDPTAGPEAAVTGTTITKANPAVCTAANHGYSDGDVVLITQGDEMTQINGALFTIGSATTNTFTLAYFNSNTANFTANTEFVVRRVPNPAFFKPSRAVITAVTVGTTTQVQMSVADLGYAVGGYLSFTVPTEFGMSQLNGVTAEILSIDTATNTYTVDVDSSAFTAFAWPAPADFNGDFAQAVAGGNQLQTNAFATQNVLMRQMKLGAGVQAPAGSNGDVIYWVAGKSYSVDNT